MTESKSRQSWQSIALASGICASFNGAFAKLTTAEITTSWALYLSQALGMNPETRLVEYAIRLVVFAMFFILSGIMWGLFTKALSLSPSAVHVNIINTSANFIISALLGVAVFGETLPGLWWVGATLLISGTVIIGSRDQEEVKESESKKKQ